MIFGKRVRLRAIEKDDLPRFVAWLNDPEVRRNLILYQPLSMGQEEQWYADILKEPVDEQPLCIDIKDGGKWEHAGNISFMQLNQARPQRRDRHLHRPKRFLEQGLRLRSHAPDGWSRLQRSQSEPHLPARL